MTNKAENSKVEWKTSSRVGYDDAVHFMENRVNDIIANVNSEMVWLLEHPKLYTAGSSAHNNEFLNKYDIPIYATNRGGKYTYHGPGQRIVYLMLDLKKRAANNAPDLKNYISLLEELIINTLAKFDVKSERRAGRVGIWTNDLQGKEAKIAAIGVRIRKWVSYHGIAVNIDPCLDYFSGIVPCGINEYGVTSCRALNKNISYDEFDIAFKESFNKIF